MPQNHLSTLAPRAVARPHCPQCRGSVLVQRSTEGRPGFEHWTLRSPNAGISTKRKFKLTP